MGTEAEAEVQAEADAEDGVKVIGDTEPEADVEAEASAGEAEEAAPMNHNTFPYCGTITGHDHANVRTHTCNLCLLRL